MIFKPYPKYTSCAIQWFNEIPQSWKQVRVEQYLIKKDENIGDLWSSTQLLSLTQKGIIEKDINEGKGKTHSDYSTYQAIDIGDLVFCLFDIDETPRTVGLSTKKGMITSAYTAFKSKENINTQYVYYFFESLDDAKALKPYYKGLRKTVRPPEFLKIHVPFPPKVEQVAISQFLDTETARIDNLIAKQEKLIELLEEQRKSIISHAVTKGLNPNAPMKDSGVEWLGEVPEHWEVTRLKNIGKSIIGLTYSPNEICNPDDDSYLVLRSSNVQNGQLSFLDNVYVKSYVSEKLKIKKNDILICSRNGSRDLIGKNTIIKNPPKNSTFGAFMTVYRSEHADYVYWILNSYIFKAQAGSYLTTTVNQLTINNLNNMTVPFAPTSEQNEIVEFLSTENLKFNNLISKQKALIEKLKEYRASIISHAVTGKIDVREFGA